jgi:benzoyl-CoA-dihydrodiol lyase
VQKAAGTEGAESRPDERIASFETAPERYAHWTLSVDPPIARLALGVDEARPLRPGYRLKQNSYDLGVDLELADAVQRLRFEHPAVRAVILSGGPERTFCAGANIGMLASSSHAFKVNFCKFTNETRLAIEDASAQSGQRYLAALNGACAGGGYELALACDEIWLVDDGSSAVSLPETPLLAVLPGTGGLTRLVDKRGVRRDHADVFCTTAEGVRGRRALEWGLVDALAPRGRFAEAVEARARELALASPERSPRGVQLPPLEKRVGQERIRWSTVELELERAGRRARLRVRGPDAAEPDEPDGIRERGAGWWPLRAFRELDDALLHLRFNEPEVGLVLIETEGELEAALALDRALEQHADDWFVGEVRALIARTLRRLDHTARSFFARIGPGSCFAGTLFELALAADRSYVLDDPERPCVVALTPQNGGAYPMSHGQSRLAARFGADAERAWALASAARRYHPAAAQIEGLVTFALDPIDHDDELRLAIEERTHFSPDALTGMEASLRFPGPETRDSKIFARLSAWQNWIFQRPNAVGEKGALTLYGRPERPVYDFTRT